VTNEHKHRLLQFARIRRAKFWLRFMPRRARFHTYPLIGRFAEFARKRNYLWSFRYPQLRASFYVGSILSLMPAMGVQLPLAFALALLLRTNVMILGGLQFITNPVTAAPIYIGTWKLGMFVIEHSGFGRSLEPEIVTLPDDQPITPPAPENLDDTLIVTLGDEPGAPAPASKAPTEPRWTSRIGTGFNALLIGGLLTGALLGAALDLLWRRFVLPAATLRQARKPVTAEITPHTTATPSLSPPADPPDKTLP
jgi:uncharacterized protein (DUF2062 family)